MDKLKANGYTIKSSNPLESAASGAAEGVKESPLMRHIIYETAKSVPSATFGTIFAALLSPLGPGASIAGAAVGGALGEAGEELREYAMEPGALDRATPASAASRIMKSGAAQGAIQGLGIGMGAASGTKTLAKGLSNKSEDAIKLGAQIMKVAHGIPEKYGGAILRDPSILRSALPVEVSEQAYKTFARYTGLKGLDDLASEPVMVGGKLQARGSMFPKEIEQMVRDTALRWRTDPASVTNQELFQASQGENAIFRMASRQNPEASAIHGSVSLSKDGATVDEALESRIPEYKSIRTNLFRSKAREALSNILPANKNLSPNVLRTTAALAAAWHMGSALPLIAVSPLTSRTIIQANELINPLLRPAAQIAARALGEGSGTAAGESWRDHLKKKK